jgi:hypothetical protein
MEGKDNILHELRLISGFVAGISRVTPYALPEAYFESLADQVLLHVRAGILPKDQKSGPIPGNAGFALPDPSEGATGDPEFRSFGSQELVYSVPTGYFEGFASKLMARIKTGQEMSETGEEELALLSPFLSRIDKKMPFQVPEGYFAGVTASLSLITGRAEMIEEKNDEFLPVTAGEEYLSSLLTGLKDKPAYQVPEGYFNELAATILGKVKQPAPAKIISFSQRRTWWKYAAAAVVTALFLTGGWLKLHNSPATAPSDITKIGSNVSDQEIESYLDNQNVPLADDLANSTASVDVSDNDIKNMFGDIPDTELKQYMDEHKAIKDLATN